MRFNQFHIEGIVSTLEGYVLKCRNEGGCAGKFLIKGRQAFIRNKGIWELLARKQTERLLDKFVNFHGKYLA